MRKFSVIRILIFIYCSNVSVSHSLTITEAINKAIINEKNIFLHATDIEISKTKKISDLSAMLPSINSTINSSKKNNEYLNYDIYNYDGYVTKASMNIKQPIFDGMKNIYEIKKANLDIKKNKILFNKHKNKIAFIVAKNFIDAVSLTKKIDILNKLIKALQYQLEAYQKKLDLGQATQNDILSIMLEIETYKAKSDVIEIDIENRINILINFLDVQITKDDIKYDDIIKNDKYEILSENDSVEKVKSSSKALISKISLKSSEYDILIERSKLMPHISFDASMNKAIYDKTKNDLNNNSYSMGINITIPIFNNTTGINKIHIAKLNKNKEKFSDKLLSDSLEQSIKEKYVKLTQLDRLIEINNRRVASSELIIENLKRQVDAGVETINDLLVAQKNLCDIESGLVDITHSKLITKFEILEITETLLKD